MSALLKKHALLYATFVSRVDTIHVPRNCFLVHGDICFGGLTDNCAGLVAKFVPGHVTKFSRCLQLLYSSGAVFVKRYFQFVGIYLQAFAIFLPATFIFVFETTAHCGNTTADSFSVPVASFQSFSQILAAYSPPKTRPERIV